MFIETENGAELRMDLAVSGEVFHNILHVRNVSGWDLASLETCRDAIEAYILSSDPLAFSNDVTITGFTLTDISKYGGEQVAQTLSPLLVGSQVGSIASLNNSVGVKKDTGLIGRAYWGYLYHVGVPESQVGDKVITAGFGATVEAWWMGLKGAMDTAGFGICLRQKTINGVPQDPYKLQYIKNFRVANYRVTGLKKRVGR